MSIASAITAAQGRVANAYTAVSNKGGTLPATQNLSNLPTAINSIPVLASKYGATMDNLVGNTNSNGVLQTPSGTFSLIFTGVKDISGYALYYKYTRTVVTSVSFPDLVEINGNQAMYSCFNNCGNLVSVYFTNLITISGSLSMYNCFYNCTGLTSVYFTNLTTISGGSAMSECFGYCSHLTSIYFPKLVTLSAANCMNNCFIGCSNITDIYFNTLTTTSFGSYTNQFYGLLNSTGSSVIHTLHFPSNLQNTIAGLNGYPTFGGTSGYVICAFDLPATS